MSEVGGKEQPTLEPARWIRASASTRESSVRDSTAMKSSSTLFVLVLVVLTSIAPAVHADCDPLIVRSTALDRGDYGTRIVGEAIHHTNEPLKNLTLSFALYKRGEGVGGASADRPVLESGDTWNFAARTSTDDFDGYRLAAKFCDRPSEGTRSVFPVPLPPEKPLLWLPSVTLLR